MRSVDVRSYLEKTGSLFTRSYGFRGWKSVVEAHWGVKGRQM